MLHYLQGLFSALDFGSLLAALVRAAAVLVCLAVHESCHGLAAWALGDPTARRQHRLSLNPLRHIDWIGLLMMFAVGFGWAKPVPVDPRYFKNPKRGMALTALAGPMSNFALALLALVLLRVLMPLLPVADWSLALLGFFLQTSQLSVGLGVFNLIPIPPLDGSKVLAAFLPDRQDYTLMHYERYGILVLLVLSFLNVGSISIAWAVNTVWWAMYSLVF